MTPGQIRYAAEHSPEAGRLAREQYARAHDKWADLQLRFQREGKPYDAEGAREMAKICFDAYMREFKDPEPE